MTRKERIAEEKNRIHTFTPAWEQYALSTWGTRLVVNEQNHVVRESGWYTIPMVGALNAAQAAMPWPNEDAFVEHPLFRNDNKQIFAIEGEGFEGMAQRITGKREVEITQLEDGSTQYHIFNSGMTQLERLLFESSDVAFVDGEVLKAHENVVSTPYYLRASWVAKQVSTTAANAETLCEAWKEIAATEKMVKTFIVWLQKKGVEAGLTYFKTMADELKKVTAVVDDIMDLGCQNVDEFEADETESAPDTQRFHLLDREDYATPWFWQQDRRFKTFINTIQNADKDALKKIGKSMFEKKPFKGQQLQVAWAEYKIRKAALYPTTKLGAQLMAKRMNGRALWNAIQANLDKLTKQDIRNLWDDFKVRTADTQLKDMQELRDQLDDVIPETLSEEEYAQYAMDMESLDGWL